MISLGKSVCRDCSVVVERMEEASKSTKKIDMRQDSPTQTCRVCCSPSQVSYFGIKTCKACRVFFQKVKKQLRNVVDQPCQQIERHCIKKCRPCRAKKCIQVGFLNRGISPSDFSVGPSQEKVVKMLISDDTSVSGLKQPNKKINSEETLTNVRGKKPQVIPNVQKLGSFSKDDAHTEEAPKKLQPKVTAKKTLVVTKNIKKENVKSREINVKSHRKTNKIMKTVKQLGRNKSQTSSTIDVIDDIEFESVDLKDITDLGTIKFNATTSNRTFFAKELGEKKLIKPNLKGEKNVSSSAVMKETCSSETRKRKNSCFGMKSFNVKKLKKISPETPILNKERENPKKPKMKATGRKETESSSHTSTFNIKGQTRQIINTEIKQHPGLKIDKKSSERNPSSAYSFNPQSDLELDYDYADVEDNEGLSGLQQCKVGDATMKDDNEILSSLPSCVRAPDDDDDEYRTPTNSCDMSMTGSEKSFDEEVLGKVEKSESEVEVSNEEVADEVEKSESEVEVNDEDLERNSENEMAKGDKGAIESEVEENLTDVDTPESELEDNLLNKDLRDSELEKNLSVKDGCEKSEAKECLSQISVSKSVEVDEKTDASEENEAGNIVQCLGYLTDRKIYRPRRARDRWNRFDDDNESDSSSDSELSPVNVKEEICSELATPDESPPPSPPSLPSTSRSVFAMPDKPPPVFAMPAVSSRFKLPKSPFKFHKSSQKKVTSQCDTIETVVVDDSISLFAPQVDLLADMPSLLTGSMWIKQENEKSVPKSSSKSRQSPSPVVKPVIISVSKRPTISSQPSTSVETLEANPTSSQSSQQTGTPILTVRSKACPKSKKPVTSADDSIAKSISSKSNEQSGTPILTSNLFEKFVPARLKPCPKSKKPVTSADNSIAISISSESNEQSRTSILTSNLFEKFVPARLKPCPKSKKPVTSADNSIAKSISSKSNEQSGTQILTTRLKPCPKSKKPLTSAANSILNSTKSSPKSLKSSLNNVSLHSPTSRQPTPAVLNSSPRPSPISKEPFTSAVLNPTPRRPTRTNQPLSLGSKPILNSPPEESPRSDFLSTEPNQPLANAKSARFAISRQPLTRASTPGPISRTSLQKPPAITSVPNSSSKQSPKSDCKVEVNKPILDSSSNLATSSNNQIPVTSNTLLDDVQPPRPADWMNSNDSDEQHAEILSKFMTAVKRREINSMETIYKQVKHYDVKLRAEMVHEMIMVYLEMKCISKAFRLVPDMRQLNIQTSSIFKALLDKIHSLPPTAQEMRSELIDYLISIHFVFDEVNLSSILDELLQKKALISLWKLVKYTEDKSYSPSVKILKWVVTQLDHREDELPTILAVFIKFQGDLNRIPSRFIQKLKTCVNKLHGIEQYQFMKFLREKNYNLDALKAPVEKSLAPSTARRKLWQEFEKTEKINEVHLNNLLCDFRIDFSDVEHTFKSFKHFVRGRIARDALFKRFVTELSFYVVMECYVRKEYKSGHAVMTATFSDGKNHFELLETTDMQSVITVQKMALACIDICLQVGDEKSAIVFLKASEGIALDNDNNDATVRLHRLQLLKLLFNKLGVCDYSNQIYVFDCYLQSNRKDKEILKKIPECGPDVTEICIKLLTRFIDINHFENARTIFTKGRENGLLLSDECFRGYLILLKRNIELVEKEELFFVFRVCQAETVYPTFDFERLPLVIKIRNYLTVEEIEVTLDCYLDELVKHLVGRKPTSTISICLEQRPFRTQLSVLNCSQDMLQTASRLFEAQRNLRPPLKLAGSSEYGRIFNVDLTSLEDCIKERQKREVSQVSASANV